MSEGKIVQVTVVGGREDEIKRVQEIVQDDLVETGDYETVVFSDESVKISELPAIDDYIDEIVERLACELEKYDQVTKPE